MAIKILVISNYNNTTGVRPEAELFIELQKSGFQVDVMTNGKCEYASRFKEHGINVIDFMPKKKFSLHAIRTIRKQLIEGDYKILHLFNSKSIINGIAASWNLPVKVILYRGYTGHIHWYDPTAYLKYLNPRVDKIVCISEATTEHIRSNMIFGREKVITIRKGHNLKWYQDIEPADLSQFGIQSRAFVIACIANARPMKGIKYLAKSLNYLPEELPIHLLLVGNNMFNKEIARILSKSRNLDKIHFQGFRNDVLNIVAASNAFILPSIKGEATTKAVIEAMALGVPPIITNLPGNRNLVLHNKNGIVVPAKNPQALASAMIRMYLNQETAFEMGCEARRHIAYEFNIYHSVLHYKRLYEELFAESISRNTYISSRQEFAFQ